MWDLRNLEMLERNSSGEIFEVLASVLLKYRVAGIRSCNVQLLNIYNIFTCRQGLDVLRRYSRINCERKLFLFELLKAEVPNIV